LLDLPAYFRGLFLSLFEVAIHLIAIPRVRPCLTPLYHVARAERDRVFCPFRILTFSLPRPYRVIMRREATMRIDSINIYHVAMPLLYPWRTAYGEDAAIEAVLVRMESGGRAAWSEVSPLAAPCYSPEWAGGVFACVRDWLAPALIGQEIASGEALQER